MLKCIAVAAVITCSGSMPRLTPAQAAAIMAVHQPELPPYVEPPRYQPQVEFNVNSTAPSHRFSSIMDRRLDGTPWSVPPAIYGLPPWHPYNVYREIALHRAHSLPRCDANCSAKGASRAANGRR